MVARAFTGVNLSVQAGVPGLTLPTAVYSASASPNTDGFRILSSITNEPATLLYLPTTKSSDLHVNKSIERVKFHGNEAGPTNLNFEPGEVFETIDGTMGKLELVLSRDRTTGKPYYDPAIDILLNTATISNKLLYIKMKRYMGLDSTLSTPKQVFHVKASLCMVRSDDNTVNADAKQVMQTFTLEGTGEWIEGYELV